MGKSLEKLLKKLKEKNHIYKLEEDYCYNTKIPVIREYSFTDTVGNELMHITESGLIIVRKGYEWDGCSPKFRIFDWGYIGIPEGTVDKNTGKRKCYYATCIHDPCYTFSEDLPYTKEQVDNFLYDLLKKSNFSLAKLYYCMVKLLGRIMW